MNSPEEILSIIEECRVIAVVGLSADPMRPSHGVAAYMKKNGYQVVPVNPAEENILGEKCFDSLSSIPFKIDLVNIFRRPDKAGEAVDQAIEIGAKAIWLQEGVIDMAAAKRAEESGLISVMDKCWLKEHFRHGR